MEASNNKNCIRLIAWKNYLRFTYFLQNFCLVRLNKVLFLQSSQTIAPTLIHYYQKSIIHFRAFTLTQSSFTDNDHSLAHYPYFARSPTQTFRIPTPTTPSPQSIQSISLPNNCCLLKTTNCAKKGFAFRLQIIQNIHDLNLWFPGVHFV